MPTYKTFTIAPNDPNAVTTLEDLIYRQPFVLLVVLGEERRQYVEYADLLAGGAVHNTWRRVVWLQQPAAVHTFLQSLQIKSGLPGLDNAAAFSISLWDVIQDVIPANVSPSKYRIYQAFTNAEVDPQGGNHE